MFIALAVAGRNLTAIRHSGYWLVVISGLLEPVFYLLAIGVGVGDLVGDFTVADGRTVSYAAFVAPAMLAASAMQGAMAESTYNFFARMRWQHLYDAMLATPLRPIEVALGELGWALLRGVLYAAGFLTLMVAMGLTSPGRALAALPATVLIGFAFGGAGLALGTLMRTWQDFDYVFVALFALFLFSGTFAPIEAYPPVLRTVIELTPLTQAVELVRAITTGTVGWVALGNTVYLALFAAAGLVIADRRLTRLLCA